MPVAGSEAAEPRTTSSERRIRYALLAIFLAALAMRIGIGHMARGRGEMEGLANRYEESAYAMAAGYGLTRSVEDAPKQVDLVKLVDSLAVRGERLSPGNAPAITRARWRPASLHPPAYSLFLLGIYRTLGPPVTEWARVLQMILDSAACLLVFAIGRRFAGVGVGLFAAMCTALFPPLAYLATSRVADAWTPALYTLVFWLYLRALDTRALGWWSATGAAIGVLWMFRPDYALYPMFLLPFAFRFVRPVHRVWLCSGILLLSTLLVVLPWGVRNLRAYGRFTLGTTAAGMTLLQSVGQFPNPYGLGVGDAWYQAEAQRHGFDSIDDPGADRLFRAEFARIARENPSFIASQAARRIPLAIAPLYHWGYDNAFYTGHGFYDYLEREHLGPIAAVRSHPLEIFHAYWDRLIFGAIALLLSIACLVLIAMERRNPVNVLLLLVPYLYLVASHLLLYMGGRLLVPGVFCQFIALGWALKRITSRQPVPQGN